MKCLRFLVFLSFAVTALGADRVEYVATTLAGSDWVGDGGLATHALLFQAEGVAVDSVGNLYIADAQDHRVRRVSSSGYISTFVSASLNAPYGLAVDHGDNLYIADLGN